MKPDRMHVQFLLAVTIVAALFISTGVMWWVVLIGGNPYEVQTIGSVNKNGDFQSSFHPGDIVAVKRHVCTSNKVGGESFPALINAKTGVRFAFPPSLAVRERGCRYATFAFVLPDLPPGKYQYVNTIRYQNNLIGRDEYTVLPPVDIEVL